MQERNELGKAAKRVLKGCPPAPTARTEEFADQWTAVREVQATLRLCRDGAIEETPTLSGGTALAINASELVSKVVDEFKIVVHQLQENHRQELLEVKKQNLEFQQLCLNLQKQSAVIQRQNARSQQHFCTIFRLPEELQTPAKEQERTVEVPEEDSSDREWIVRD
ncbi:hypothetical protein VTI74DRAFT_40 [Chaetomium olivicolor]